MSDSLHTPSRAADPQPGGYERPLAQSYGALSAPQNGHGLAAIILGIAATVLFWVPFLYLITAIPAGIIAIVQGAKGRKLADQGLATNRGQATAGLVLGIIGLTLCAMSMVLGAIIGAVSAATV